MLNPGIDEFFFLFRQAAIIGEYSMPGVGVPGGHPLIADYFRDGFCPAGDFFIFI